MGVFAHGCFSDFIIMGVLVARFAHVTGFGRVCCWPTLVCVAEGGGGRWVGLHMVGPLVA